MRRNDVRPHRIDHLQRAVRRVIPLDILRPDVNRKELRAQKTLHPRKIRLPTLVWRRDVVAVDRLRSDVVMRIDQNRIPRNRRDFGIGHRFCSGRLSHNRKAATTKRETATSERDRRTGFLSKIGLS